jgi:hypothetical protein
MMKRGSDSNGEIKAQKQPLRGRRQRQQKSRYSV